MPNWVTNVVVLSGDEAQISDLKKKIRGEDRCFDFCSILPEPAGMDDIHSGYSTIDGVKVNNWRVSVDEDGKELKVAVSEKELETLRQEHGATDLYHWHINNWDTKWNSCYCDTEWSGNKIEFDTAWGTPLAVFIKLSALFPAVKIEVDYADEDIGQNCGQLQFLGGEMIGQNEPSGVMAEDFALKTKGYDPEEYRAMQGAD